MRSLIAAVLVVALAVPAYALNPQPEPPGKPKIKRIYSGKDGSRKPTKPSKPSPVNAPATKY